MKFNTERLEIRLLNEDDIDKLVLYRNKKEVALYQSWNKYTKKEAIKRVQYVNTHPFTGKVKDNTQLAITYNGELIGDLHLEVLSLYTFTIGYTLDSTYWKNGFGREAVNGLLEYLKNHFNQKKVVAYIYKDNIASKRLLLDLGFKKFDESFIYQDEGYIRKL